MLWAALVTHIGTLMRQKVLVQAQVKLMKDRVESNSRRCSRDLNARTLVNNAANFTINSNSTTRRRRRLTSKIVTVSLLSNPPLNLK